MKILFVLHQDPLGYPAGIEQYLLDLMHGLRDEFNCKIYLFFPKGDKCILRFVSNNNGDDKIIPATKVDLTTVSNKIIENVFLDVLNQHKFDIVHFQSLRNLPLSLVECAKENGRAIILSIHDYFIWCVNFILLNPNFCYFESNDVKCYECLRKLGYNVSCDYISCRRNYVSHLMNIVDAIICPSHYIRDLLVELFSSSVLDRTIIIENGSKKSDFLYNRQDTLSLSNKYLKVAFIGNFLRHKGSKLFEELLNEFENGNEIKFYIIGNLYERLQKTSRNLAVIGGYYRGNMGKILFENQIDIALLLSIIPETFSFTLSEVILAEIPTLALDLGAIRDRISRYKTGILIPHENSVPYLKNHLEYFIKNKSILSSFKNNCKKAKKLIPNTSNMVRNYYELYLRLLETF